MATFRPLFKLRVGSAVTPPTLVEGEIPYGQLVSRYSYCTATWIDDAAPFFDGTPLSDAILAYQTSLTDEGEVVLLFPRGVYLDFVGEFDGGGTAEGNGQPPVQVKYKAWGAAEQSLPDFTGALNGQEVPGPLPARIEVERLTLKSTFLRGTFPTQLRLMGAHPDFATAVPMAQPVPQEIANIFGLCFNWYDFNLEDPEDLLVYSCFRDYGEVENMKRPEGYRFGPSFNVDRDAQFALFKSRGKEYFPCFNHNFWSKRPGFIDAGLGNSEWENSYGAVDADLEDPETYREMAEFAYQLFFREGSTAGDLADSLCVTTPRYEGEPSDQLQQVLTGLNTLKVASFFNESYKTWMSKLQHMTAKAAAVAFLAINFGIGLSGDTSKLGVKNADPNGEGYIGQAFGTFPWLALNTFIEIGNIGGRNSDGTNIYQPAYFELHDYLRDLLGHGLPFELSGMADALRALADIIRRYSPRTKLVMGEWGFTTDVNATGYVNGAFVNGYSYLYAAHGYTAAERHAAITFMQGIFMTYFGVTYGMLYQATNQAASAPGTNWDKLAGQLHTLLHQWAKVFVPLFTRYVPVHCSNPTLDPTQPYVFTCQVPGEPDLPTIYILYATGAAQLPVTLTLPNGGILKGFDGSETAITAPLIAREMPQLVIATT